MVLPLPPELTDRIIDYLHKDTHSLRACALACRTWLPAARYHRFRVITVENSGGGKFTTFEKLLASSPAIGLIVETLRISFSTYKRLSALPSLPAVSLLALHDIDFDQLAMSDVATVGAKLPALRRLAIALSSLPWDALAGLLSSFTGLETLSILQINGVGPVLSSSPVVGRLDTLHTLQLHGRPGNIMPWLLQTLDLIRVSHPRFVQCLVDAFGSRGLKHLSLDLYCPEASCYASQDTGQTDSDLLWSSVLISQLHSPFLETITLTIDAPLLDLDVPSRRFDTLRALDWPNINRTLERLFSKDLRVFNIYGRGPKGSWRPVWRRVVECVRRGLFRLIEA
ncbi:uncharacterized protein B0H18DRAFT_1042552 [Fomitopsis serialis]|uniref:uncharacterized protein n=1 Tax=Fomitopsis serialis TaxID=139415 RepID=UPI002007DBDE|nr:uncharacterized protein B0H18DRAFT_1042552 [Neoantrodia serialis]KAH9915107.1 hypothetical protein B0H18DRAFT_1042552 [Neoantrodia serialis]